MKSISEKRGIRLTGMTIDEVIQLLQRNHYSDGLRKIEQITIKMEYSTFDESTHCIRDLFNPRPTDKYTVEFDDTVDLYRNSKDELKDMCFDTDIIP